MSEHTKEDLLDLYTASCIIDRILDNSKKEFFKVKLRKSAKKKSNNIKKTLKRSLPELERRRPLKRINMIGSGNIKEDFISLIHGKITTCKQKIDILYAKIGGDYRRMKITNYIIKCIEMFTCKRMCQALFFFIIVQPFLPSIPNIISETLETKNLFENLYLQDGTTNNTIMRLASETYSERYKYWNDTTNPIIQNITPDVAFQIFMKDSLKIIHNFNNTIPTNSQLLLSTYIPKKIFNSLFASSIFVCLFATPLYIFYMQFFEEVINARDFNNPLVRTFLRYLDLSTKKRYNFHERYSKFRLENRDRLLIIKKRLFDDVKLARKKITDVDDAWMRTNTLKIPSDLKTVIVQELIGSKEQILDDATTQAFDNIIRNQGGRKKLP